MTRPLDELVDFLDKQKDKLLELQDRILADKTLAVLAGCEAQADLQQEFYKKVGIQGRARLTDANVTGDELVTAEVSAAAGTLAKVAAHLKGLLEKKKYADQRLKSAQLLIEEVAELLKGMAAMDELATLDALADLDYVVHGRASMMDLPLGEAFLAVHRSNMTKGGDGREPIERCPRCDSPDPARHPAMQFEGEVQVCPHPWHTAKLSAHAAKGEGFVAPTRELMEALLAYRKEQLSPHRIVLTGSRLRCDLCDVQLSTMFRDLDKYGRSKCFGRKTL